LSVGGRPAILRDMSRRETFPVALPVRSRLAYMAAWCWWSLRVHVAELNHLPRVAAGPPPERNWPSGHP